jgi:hypothetical protein
LLVTDGALTDCISGDEGVGTETVVGEEEEEGEEDEDEEDEEQDDEDVAGGAAGAPQMLRAADEPHLPSCSVTRTSGEEEDEPGESRMEARERICIRGEATFSSCSSFSSNSMTFGSGWVGC